MLTLWPCTDAVTSSVPEASHCSSSSGAVCPLKCATTARLTTSRTITVPTTPESPSALASLCGDSLCPKDKALRSLHGKMERSRAFLPSLEAQHGKASQMAAERNIMHASIVQEILQGIRHVITLCWRPPMSQSATGRTGWTHTCSLPPPGPAAACRQ